MRLSGLVIAAILLFSTTLLAQHSSGGGGASSGGHSGGSSSGGSSHSSAGSTGSSHGSGSASSSARSDRATADSSRSRSSKETTRIDARPGPDVRAHEPQPPSGMKPEKRSIVSFLRHPFQRPKPVTTAKFRRPPCRKEPCAVCPPGESRHGRGGCMSSAIESNECQAGLVWNGFGCGTRYLVNDCSALAAQLEQQDQLMHSVMTSQQQSCSRDSASPECADLQGQSGRESLRYRQLREQYNQCMAHSRSFAFGGTLLPGIP